MAPAGRRHQVLVHITSYFIFLFLWLRMFSQMLNASMMNLLWLSPRLHLLCVTGTGRVENSPVAFPSAFLGFGGLIASLIGCSMLC